MGVTLLLLSVPPCLDVIGPQDRKSIEIAPYVSLAVVVGLLAIARVASILWPRLDSARHGTAIESGITGRPRGGRSGGACV